LQLLQTTPLLLHLHPQLLLLPTQVDCVNRLRISPIALIVVHTIVEHDDYSTSTLLLIAASPNHSPSPTRHALPTSVVASSGSLIVLLISVACITVEHNAYGIQAHTIFTQNIVHCSSSKPLYLSHFTCTPN